MCYLCFAMSLLTSTVLILFDLSDTKIYIGVLFQMFFLITAFNIVFVFKETRTDLKLMQISIELNLTFALMTTFLSPIIVTLGEIPILGFIWFFSAVAIATIKSIGGQKAAVR